MSLFRLDNVWVERPGERGQVRRILMGASATVPDRGITCLVGPSGAGKTTLLRLLNRLEDPDRGSILFRGKETRDLDPLVLRRRVALVLQTPVMLPGTVRDNLEAGLRMRGRNPSAAHDWLERVGLPYGMLNQTAAELSVGEKQRVALARTLAIEPEALLLDEVTASLDQETAGLVERVITELGLPALWVSHDPAQVRRVADQVLWLEQGLLREEAIR